jgi:hypothetical protein
VIPTPPAYHDGPFTCSIPIIRQGGSRSEASERASLSTYASGPATGAASVYLFGRFQTAFGAEARFTLPPQPSNRGLFYSNWIILKPLHGAAFVQLELMRWKRYAYRDEIGLTWSHSDGKLIYRDTEVFATSGSHRLRVSRTDGDIVFAVDDRVVCRAPSAAFFTSRDQLYYQLGTEVSRYGDRPTGTLSDIRVKRDGDATYHTARVSCIYRGYGLSWEYAGNGTYRADGVFDPTQPYLRFTGNNWDSPCSY